MDETKTSVKGMIYASMFGAATAAGAYIIIPLPPVPITFQTFFVYLAAALLGGRLGALSQFIYILLGVIGLPVFSGGKGGLGVLFGPTGGYLTGFLVAAFVIGKLVEMKKGANLTWLLIPMVVGTLIIYLLGILQLTLVAKLTLLKAISVGMLPFLIGDAVKIVVAGLVTIKVRDKVVI